MENAAQILRDEGIRRAVDKADKVHEQWSDKAYYLLGEYIDLIGGAGACLTAEMVRFYSEEQGLPKPPDGRAWGAVMLKAARSGRIFRNGWVTASDPKSHGNPTTLWEATR